MARSIEVLPLPTEDKALKTRGRLLLEDPFRNKGTAFSEEERLKYGLNGLLPSHVETLEKQTVRAYAAFGDKSSDLEKHIYLRQLQDENERLYFNLLKQHIVEMLPIVYTPTVGLACERFSHIYRRPRGLFIDYPNRNDIDQLFENFGERDIEVIVVTDGQRILGLGDQGAGGMGIPIGKLSLYTLCGGINPSKTLPIFLDVGTNNEELLNDPAYFGWRHERISGEEYDQFLESFVASVKSRFPNVLLQWEDFASANATRILETYTDQVCSFNDDIQGTAAVTVGALIAAGKIVEQDLSEQRVMILGAGSAGCGIADHIVSMKVEQGVELATAREQVYVFDSKGLVHDNRDTLAPYQVDLAQSYERLRTLMPNQEPWKNVSDVISTVHPHVLIGVTGRGGMFTEEMIRQMYKHVDRPIIFPLSNPTTCSEAVPEDLLKWTDGTALIATGSPFEHAGFNGRQIAIAQCNNCYIFPAMGLAVASVKATQVTDGMFRAATLALGSLAKLDSLQNTSLLPELTDIVQATKTIAIAVAKQAIEEGVAAPLNVPLEQVIEEKFWTPEYGPMEV
ncbi:MAG: NAD-dependent malic enzyme [Mariniblastus sp.]